MTPDAIEYRIGTPADVPAIMAIKKALAITLENTMEGGGFLLGSDESTYQALAHAGQLHVLLLDGDLIGFCTVLEDTFFRGSDVFERREKIQWEDFSPQEIFAEPIAYLDQLAIASGKHRARLGSWLAMCAVEAAFASGHRHVFTTTLVEPLTNHAAIPLIYRAGGRTVGHLREEYPQVGEVTSAIHHISAQRFEAALQEVARAGSDEEKKTLGAIRAWQAAQKR